MKPVWILVVLLAFFTGAVAPVARGDGFDVVEPRYDGVDQLLLLSDRWVIVVTSNIEAVMAEVDRLSDGKFKRSLATWELTRTTLLPDWGSSKNLRTLRETYIAQARENVGDTALGLTTSYSISSSDDERYAKGSPPKETVRLLVGLGGRRVAGGPDVDYAHYAYLKMPEPLRNGKQYEIKVRGEASVSFRYDENHLVSRAIKVNQAGYLPSASHKIAYLGAHLYDAGPMDCSMYPTFDVVDATTGTAAFTGPLVLRDKNSRVAAKKDDATNGKTPALIHGENLYELDFSALKAQGEFFIRIPGVGRSWPFRHADDAYGEVFYTAARGLYHQRCGIAYETPYTNWKRPLCHTDPIYESEHISFPKGKNEQPEGYERFDVIAATLDKKQKTENVRGGWHDAADWDRVDTHYAPIFDMLYAYEMAPEKFTDSQLNIPESGNGIPDILDEVAYGLAVWEKSMKANGGVAGHVETWTHPEIDSEVDYAFSRRTRWDSLLFAAAAAQLSEQLTSLAPTRSEELKAEALKAYSFGANPANSLGKVTFHARHDRGKGDPYTLEWEEKDSYIEAYLLLAKVRLYRITQDKQYIEGLGGLLDTPLRPYAWPCSITDFSPWFFFSLVHGPEAILPKFQRLKIIKSYFLEPADKLLGYIETMPYRHSWPRDQDYWQGWGATVMTNPGRALLIAFALTGDEKYRDAALLNMDFMFGGNPMGMSWTTGIGYVYPTDIQHTVSRDDGIADPVPGITIYGITGGVYPALREQVWQSPGGSMSKEPVVYQDPKTPVWRRWSCHPSLNTAQCEFTIHETNSSTIFCAAMMLSEGWKPSEALKKRQPTAPALLHGRWYLP